MATNDEKQLIVDNLLESVKQCQIRFGGRSELATDFDERVITLCHALEAALSHGLKKNRNLLNYTRKMVMNGITKSSSASLGLSESQETNVCFWHFVSLHLNRHEFDRYLLLRNVRTDMGRGKSWLRSALNEHSLERYVLMMLEDNLTLRSQFYDDKALLRDEDRNSVLPTISRGLNSILFAINIDNPEFDVSSDHNCKAIDNNDSAEPLPVVFKSLPNTSGVKKRRTRVNVISLSDDESDNENSVYARSAPTTSLSSPDSVFTNSNFVAICEKSNNNETLETEQKSEFVPIGTDSLGKDVVLTPIGGDNTNSLNPNIEDDVSDSDKLSFTEPEVQKLEINSEFVNKDKEELALIRSEMKCLKDKYEEKLIKLETMNDNYKKENDILKMQLKKYIAAVQLLKYGEKKEFDDLSNSSEKSITQKVDNSQNFLYINEVNEYEKKLVQVAEMHGELVEFNDHLHRVILQKEAIIKRLREELVDLRGPFPEINSTPVDDIVSIASDFETSISMQSSINHTLIHVWIPTAFLAGGQKSQSHHVYQIYIRIKDEEWNVYRRYSQFHTLHKSLRKKFQILNTFDFPPKKTIGNKDSKVVQERRKKLEHYLRSLINFLQTQHNDINDKQHLIAVLPFLSERVLQSEGRSRSDTQLNLPNTADPQLHHHQQQQQHYMGL